MAQRKLITATAVAAALSAGSTYAIEITGTSDAQALADILTLGETTGIIVTNAALEVGVEGGEGGYGGEFEATGASSFSKLAVGDIPGEPGPISSGVYENNSGTYNLPAPGIVLSTGNVYDYEDNPDQEIFGSTSFENTATPEQNALLSPITGQTDHFDVTRLTITFDVDANTDSVSFIGLFGSEEFPDFVGDTFIDGFGLYLNGNNIAVVEPTGGGTANPVNINHPDFTPDIPGTILNGVLAPNGNPLLRFDAPVTPGSTGNTFDIIISDTGDNGYDSTTFLASFGAVGASEFIPVLPVNGEPDENGAFNFELPPVPQGTIWIDPIVAVGYTYEITDGFFTAVTLPTTVPDPDGYEVWAGGMLLATVMGGDTYTFLDNYSIFEIRDIDPDLGLDPNNPLAFATGIDYVYNGNAPTAPVSMTPITANVPGTIPAPASLALLVTGLGVMGWRRGKSASSD